MRVVGEDAPTTPADKWTTAGTSVAKVDGRAFVTGATRYASDVKRPGMLVGKVLRPPSFKATLVSVKTADAEALPGVTVVHDGDFVGVAAPSEHEAEEALDAASGRMARDAAAVQRRTCSSTSRTTPAPAEAAASAGEAIRAARSMKGLKAADARLEATYTVAYIAHAPLEPRAAVAEWADGKLTVWTGTQRPFGVRGELARALEPARRTASASSSPTWVPATAASTPARRRWRRRGWPRRRASRSSWSGRGRRNSPGPTSGRPASST